MVDILRKSELNLYMYKFSCIILFFSCIKKKTNLKKDSVSEVENIIQESNEGEQKVGKYSQEHINKLKISTETPLDNKCNICGEIIINYRRHSCLLLKSSTPKGQKNSVNKCEIDTTANEILEKCTICDKIFPNGSYHNCKYCINYNSSTTLKKTSNDRGGDKNETEKIVNNDLEDNKDIEDNNNHEGENDVDDPKKEEGLKEETYVLKTVSHEKDVHKHLLKPIIEDMDEGVLVAEMNIEETVALEEDTHKYLPKPIMENDDEGMLLDDMNFIEEPYVSGIDVHEEDIHQHMSKPIVEDIDEDTLIDDMNSILENVVVDEDKGRIVNIIIKIIKKRKSKTKVINGKKIKKLFRLSLTKKENNREKRIKFDVNKIEKGACNLSLKLMGTHYESSKTKVLEEIELDFIEIDGGNTVMIFGIPEEDMGDNFYNFYDPISVKDSMISKGENYQNIHLKVIAKINGIIAFEGVIV